MVGHTTYDYYVVAWPRMIKETVLPLRWGRGQGGGREKGREGGGEEGEGREKWLLKTAATGATTGSDLPRKRARRMRRFWMLERNKAREWGRLGEMRGGGRRFQERGGERTSKGESGRCYRRLEGPGAFFCEAR